MERVPQRPQPHLPQEHKPRAISVARGMHLMKSALKALAHTAPKVMPTHQHPLPCVSAAPCHIVPCLMVLGPRGWWIWMSQQCAEPATVRGMWGKETGYKTGDVPHPSSKAPPCHISFTGCQQHCLTPWKTPRGVSGESTCSSPFLAGVRIGPVFSSVG